MLRPLVVSLFILLLSTAAGAGQLEDSQKAYVCHDWHTALSLLMPLAKNGNPEVELKIVDMYEHGWGVKRDHSAASAWFRKALNHYRDMAEKGDANAQFFLGMAYGYGDGQWVDHDAAEAVKWWKMAAEQGNANAQVELSNSYEHGLGVVQDSVEASKWHDKAWNQPILPVPSRIDTPISCDTGESSRFLDAKTRIERATGAAGNGDYKTAMKMLQPLVDQGNPTAEFLMGNIYEGLRKDVKDSLKWWRKAAEQGDPNAEHTLGVLYSVGRGVKQDYGEAMKWHRKAAEQGDEYAQSLVGELYENGLGVKQDYAEAYFWKKVSGRWDPGGGNEFEYLASHLTVQQVAAVVRRVEKWKRIHPTAAVDGYLGLIRAAKRRHRHHERLFYPRSNVWIEWPRPRTR